MHAIILDGHIKSALATVRSLSKHGVIVSVGAVRKTAMGLHSRYTDHGFVYPSPYTDQEGFIETIKAEAKRLGGKPVVYAFSDATFVSLYNYRETLKEYVTLQFPDDKSIEIAFDKAATQSLARISGVPTITTHIPEIGDELRRVAEGMEYPAVLKTRRSVTWKEGKGVFGSAQFVHGPDELKEQFQTLKHTLGEAPLIQKFIRGEEYGVEMLVEKGKVYAQVVHHRLRSLSPTGGASVLKETLYGGDLKETLTAHAHTLVQKLLWTGPIMVEFKVDADTMTPYLMEINGRFWGSLPLSLYAGVDVPSLYFAALTKGQIPSEVVQGRDGVRSTHFLGDTVHLARVLFARDRMRKIVYPKRMSAIRDFLRISLGVRNDVWSFHDMKPSVMEFVDIVQSKVKK